ncbi:hypothetical protein [Ferrimonas sp. SCSIO 43195]|uniref:hypothetical protein n=1 Tax=Ferrimonas sp. SCSIO 43195 TaxID=2822844 RepID=UPI0020758CB7|nr:hypothetical protein [Ferrimonas sp. SCSIO 43195]USD36074.1 hypothetical protein J8Z22_13625 [Ferrimonas sp. SCSIO 43195]
MPHRSPPCCRPTTQRLLLALLLFLCAPAFACPQAKKSGTPASTAARFDGVDAYLSLPAWSPKGAFTLVAWVAKVQLTTPLFLLSDPGSDSHLALTQEGLSSRWHGQQLDLAMPLSADAIRYIELRIEPGLLTLSDGTQQRQLKHPAILEGKVQWQQVMRSGNLFSHATLQALALIDINDIPSSRSYSFDHLCQLKQSAGTAPKTASLMGNVSWQPGMAMPPAPAPLIGSQQQWDEAFAQSFDTSRPLLAENNGNDEAKLAWQGYYWLRAYITMHQTFGDGRYLDYAVELADHMLGHTDQQRWQQSRLDLAAQPYASAPKYYLNQPETAAPGWRRPHSGWRIEVLSDGQILNAITRLADHIKSNPELPHQSRADHYLSQAKIIIDSHDSSFSTSKNSTIGGAYFYVNTDNRAMGDSGLYANPLPYNHQLTQASAMARVNRWQPDPQLQKKVSQILAFFEAGVRYHQDGSCEWDYALNPTRPRRSEDLNHGHMDIGFLLTARDLGYPLDPRLLPCAAQTLSQRTFLPPAMMAHDLKGEGLSTRWDQVAIGYDWFELREYDADIALISQHVLRQFGSLTWVRPFLAWANQLRWQQQHQPQTLRGWILPEAPPASTRTEDSR